MCEQKRNNRNFYTEQEHKSIENKEIILFSMQCWQFQYWFHLFFSFCCALLLRISLIVRENILMFRWCNKSRHIDPIAPLSSHDKNGIGMHSGTNQWIHLSHEATQPTMVEGIKKNCTFSDHVVKLTFEILTTASK